MYLRVGYLIHFTICMPQFKIQLKKTQSSLHILYKVTIFTIAYTDTHNKIHSNLNFKNHKNSAQAVLFAK